jgi:hypothetical protein
MNTEFDIEKSAPYGRPTWRQSCVSVLRDVSRLVPGMDFWRPILYMFLGAITVITGATLLFWFMSMTQSGLLVYSPFDGIFGAISRGAHGAA